MFAQEQTPPQQILLNNVNVFDGTSESLLIGQNVLIEGKLIKQVSAGAISAPDARAIDGEGRTLLPGLIDMHSHLFAVSDLKARK